jgi:curved DNA-binding protein
MEFKDYYATLGVPKTATDKEIKQAYRKLARKYHPDVNPGDKAAEARFKEINEAYEVLGDPEKRRKYDELAANWRLYEQAQRSGFNPFAAGGPFGEGGPFGRTGPFRGWSFDFGSGQFRNGSLGDLFDEEADLFSEFFRTFFGDMPPTDRARGRASRARGGRDLEHDVELTLEEAFHGTTRRLALARGGATRTLEVRIPPGVDEGSRVRVAGEGEPGTGGAPAGDLYLRVRLRPHPRFDRKGADLYTRVVVPVTTAVLGGEVEVPTLAGTRLRLKIPPTTQPGQVFRLRGQGMPLLAKPGERGDLYATVEIELPRQLTPELRRAWEALARLEQAAPVASRP